MKPDPDHPYVTAEDSRKPGYLHRKFAKIRAQQKEAEAERVKAEAETKEMVIDLTEVRSRKS